MSYCKTFKYPGFGACDALRTSVRGIVLMDKGTTLTLANAAIIGADSTGWASVLAPLLATSVYETGTLIDILRGYDINTDAPEMTKSNLNFEEQTNEVMPKMTAYAKMSYSDYKAFFRAHGKTFDIALIDENGNPIMAETTTVGTYKGFRGRLFVNKGGIPKVGADKQKEYEFRILFDDPGEWETITLIESAFSFSDLIDICPEGLDVTVTSAYSTPNATIKVNYRNTTTPYGGIVDEANLQVIESPNDLVAAVSAVDVTNAAVGTYVLTATADLNGPVWARITKEATNRTFVSQMFRLV